MSKNQRNVVLGVLAVAAIAYAGYRIMRGGKAQSLQTVRNFTGYGVCLNCKQEAIVTFGANELPPYHCEACGEDAFYLWWYCRECKYRFIPDLIRKPGQPPRPNPYPRCTHCGCSDVCGWDPDNPYQVPQGDAPLPKWP